MADPARRSLRTASVRLVPLHASHPSLLDLWARYRFQARTLARMADVPESTVDEDEHSTEDSVLRKRVQMNETEQ